jgi:hypothetical protein
MKMLKKSLIAIAVLAIAMPVVAGDLKVHNWPCQYQPVEVAKIDVQLNVGYYIHILNQDPILVNQDSSASNPYETYVGCFNSDVESNFNATLTASVKGTSAAGGKWSVTSGASIPIPVGTTPITVCVKATELKIGKLTGGATKVKVAEITFKAVPSPNCQGC